MASLNRIFYGHPFPFPPWAASPTTHALDASNDALEFVFQAVEAATITRLGFNYGARTGTPPTYIISLQGVSSGMANGTIKGGGSPASVTFTPPASTAWDQTFQWQTLANSYTCTRGELLSVVIAYSSGTVNGSNNSTFGAFLTAGDYQNFPYAVLVTAGAKVKNTTGVPIFGYAAGTTAYGNPVIGQQARTINSGSANADEYGLAFQIPGTGGTFKVAGVRAFANPSAIGSSTAKFILYSGTTVLQEITWSGYNANSTGSGWLDVYFTDSTLATLNTGTTYRVAMQPQSATNWSLRSLSLASADDRSAFAGGTNWHETRRIDAGAWSDTTTFRPIMGLILDDLTLPTPGALMFHPGMSGGMEG